MKVSMELSVVFGLALLGVGSAITCYKCQDSNGNCTATENCRFDACLTLSGIGGQTYRQCLKYSDCDSAKLSQLFKISKFTFKCCQTDLCNGASVVTGSSSVLGLLVSLAVLWWCIL